MIFYQSLKDEELIALLKQGDHGAFTEIYKRYAILIYNHVYKMLQDGEAAEDLVQDLFITIWNKANNIKEDANLIGYLYIAARNRVLKSVQSGSYKKDYLESLENYANETNWYILEKLEEKDLQRLIEQEIMELPEKMRIIFELSRKEHLTHQQIADKLGISPETVKKQVKNAIKILKPKITFHLYLSFLMIMLK